MDEVEDINLFVKNGKNKKSNMTNKVIKLSSDDKWI